MADTFEYRFTPEPVQRRAPTRDEQRDSASLCAALHDRVIVVNDDVAGRDEAEQFRKGQRACVYQRAQARGRTSKPVGDKPGLQPALKFGAGGKTRRIVDQALDVVLRQQVTFESGDHPRVTFASGQSTSSGSVPER